MKLFTKEIERKLQAQFHLGASLDQKVICKIFNPYGGQSWYIMNQDPEDPDYLWGICDYPEVECGSMLKSDFENIRIKVWGAELPLERDLHFKEVNAKELMNELNKLYI
jgi:hypothetical protein